MRLHHLRMTAFQPFAGLEEVDFDDLGQAGLFLMQGETGAGKTAILDAICFALFGHVPGLRDTAARLRSDHATAAERTEITLELTLGGRRLRVTRSPKQERPKVRGSGTTEEPARALLEARGADEDTWTVLAEKIEAVDHELSALLGLTLGQFCQVVLLPQGAFARFLHATSDDREKILQQLFATDRYAAAEHWLLDRRRAADSAMYGGLDAVSDVASRIAAVAGEEPPPDWRERPEMLTEWIQNLAVLAQATEATAEGRRSSATDVRRGAHEALSAAQALHERQRRHADAVAGLAAHLKAEDRRAESAGRVADARRAEPVTALAAGAGRAREEATHRGALASVALEALTHDRDDELQSDPAQLMLIEAPTLRAQDAWEHSGRRREQAALARRFLDAEAELTAAEAGLRSARVRREARERDLAERTEWIARAEPRLPELRAAVDAARAAAAALPGRKGAADEATRRAEAAIRRDGLRRELMTARAREQDALASANAAREAWLDARERRLSGIAGELAGELRDGEACRVCGSLEHPAPAHGDGDERVDAETERALGEEATGKSSALEQARADCAEHERALAAAVAVAGEDAGDALTAAASQAAAQLRDTQAAAEREQAAVDALTAHERMLQERRREAGELTEAIAQARAELRSQEEQLARDREAVSQARGEDPTVAARVARLEGLAVQWSEAATALSDASTAQLEADRRDREAATEARRHGFGTVEQAVAAALPAEARERLEAWIIAFDRELERLRAITEDESLQAAAAEPAPDIAGLERAVAGADEELARAQSAQGLAAERMTKLTSLGADLGDRLQALAPLVRERDLIASVAGLVDGTSASNRLHMPLAAYVLTARLEQIAQAASQRLERMSGGRYLLAHCDERIGRNRKAGLGLQVLDAWTGRERPPSSLSGGETFQASLALALGLADIVAAEAGAARLETLFVDEGFGTLGERALDDVLDVLDTLREGGRSVGVISHVAEMRQRIPTALVVDKRRNGSRILQG